MSPESERLRRVTRTPPEPELEREVDFGRYARAVLARWWLPVAGLILGAVAGFLLATSESSVYQAQATVYLGQPLSATGGTSLTGPVSDAPGVAAIARSQVVVEEVSAQVGIPPARLRRSISANAVGETRRAAASEVTLVGISVRGSESAKVEQAANLLAAAVVERVSRYANAKIETLEQRLAAQERGLESVDARLETLTAAIQDQSGLSSVERLTLTNLLGVLELQRAGLADERLQTEQLLSLAREVERGSVVTEAAAAKVDARSSRTSIVVGAFIGLLVGLAAALLWEPVARLRAA